MAMENEKTSVSSAQSDSKVPGEYTDKQYMRYSGFWVRWAARMIDGFVIFVITIIMTVPIMILLGLVSIVPGVGHVSQFIGTCMGAIIGWVYYIFMTHKYQATLGKMAVGMHVVAEDGTTLSLKQVVLRETIGKIVSGLIVGIGYIMVAFTSQKKALHDYIARSVVIYKDPIQGPRISVVAIVYVIFGACVLFVTIMGILFILVFGALIMHSADWQDNVHTIPTTEIEQKYDGMSEIFDGLSDELSDISNENADYTIEQM